MNVPVAFEQTKKRGSFGAGSPTRSDAYSARPPNADQNASGSLPSLTWTNVLPPRPFYIILYNIMKLILILILKTENIQLKFKNIITKIISS